MDKKESGRLGGRETVRRYGPEYMHRLAVKAAEAMHTKYRMEPVSLYDFVFVDRETGETTGRTICGHKIA